MYDEKYMKDKRKHIEEMKLKIGSLSNKELEFANQAFKQFDSSHEAYAIIKEEIEESLEEFETVENSLGKYWEYCKKSYLLYMDQYNFRINHLNIMNKQITSLIYELIQVGAMVQKSIDFENKQKESIKKVIENDKNEYDIDKIKYESYKIIFEHDDLWLNKKFQFGYKDTVYSIGKIEGFGNNKIKFKIGNTLYEMLMSEFLKKFGSERIN